MVVFMLRNDDTGKWYRRNAHILGHWFDQQDASVWPSKQGPVAARTAVRKIASQRKREAPEMTIVEFNLVPVRVPE